MHALVTSRHVDFRLGSIWIFINLDLEIVLNWSRNTLVRRPCIHALLVVKSSRQVRSLDLNLLLSRPQRLSSRLKHNFTLIVYHTECHGHLVSIRDFKGLLRRRQVLPLLHLACSLLVGIDHVVCCLCLNIRRQRRRGIRANIIIIIHFNLQH